MPHQSLNSLADLLRDYEMPSTAALEFIIPEETPVDCGNVVPRHTLGNATGAATAISPVQSPCHTTDANCDDADYMVAEDIAMVDVTDLHPGNCAQGSVTGDTPFNTVPGPLHLHSAPIWSCKQQKLVVWPILQPCKHYEMSSERPSWSADSLSCPDGSCP
jgi:hypothetical protein